MGAVIDQSGEPVAVELLWLQHHAPQISEWETVERALAAAKSIEDYGDGSTVAVLVGGEVRHVHGSDLEWHPAGERPRDDAEAAALYREVCDRDRRCLPS